MYKRQLLIGLFSCDSSSLKKNVKDDSPLTFSKFSKSLEPIKYIIDAEEGVWNWGMAPMYDSKGLLHVFMSVIPNDGSWIKNSKIVHFTAQNPEGPYTFVENSLVSEEASYHNPQISKVGDTYVLVYLLNKYKENGSFQEVGIATTNSLDSAWVESSLNPVIPASGKMNGANIIHASNPTFVCTPEGKYRIYYKSMTDKAKPHFREISFAESDKLEGPYVNYENNPVISFADKGVDIEDPYAFYYNGMYYMITEDRTGVANLYAKHPIAQKKIKPGGRRPGLLFKSKDGIHWDKPSLSYQTNEFYFGDKLARSERPNILWENGKPTHLYLACHDDKPSAGYVLKIKDWLGE